jgi:O-antigen/teichoic acid export membrane protein
MSAVKSVARNTTWLFISYTVSSAFNFFYNMYTARYLAPEGYGLLNFAIAFVGIFNVIADLGISVLATRDVARDNSIAGKYFDGAIKIKLVLSAITLSMVMAITLLNRYPGDTVLVIGLIAVGNLINSFSMLYNSIFQGFERMEYQSIGGIFYSLLMLASAIYLIDGHYGIIAFAVAYFGANLVLLVFYTLICQLKFFSPIPDLSLDWGYVKRIVAEGWPMGAMALSVAIFSRVDMVMLEFMKGGIAVGLYSAAYKFSDLSTVIPIMFTSAIYPIIAKYYRSARSSFVYSYEKSLKILFYIAVPMAFLVTLFAGTIITLYYKGDYNGSIIALEILIWGAAGVYITMALGNTMVTADLQRLQMKVVIAIAAINIALNYVLITAFGYTGSAVAMVSTQWLLAVIYLYYLEKYGYRIKLASVFVPPVLALAAMAITYWALAGMGVSTYIIAVVTMAEYLIIVLPLGVKKDDIELIKILKG